VRLSFLYFDNPAEWSLLVRFHVRNRFAGSRGFRRAKTAPRALRTAPLPLYQIHCFLPILHCASVSTADDKASRQLAVRRALATYPQTHPCPNPVWDLVFHSPSAEVVFDRLLTVC
jgi:hypothetical protein